MEAIWNLTRICPWNCSICCMSAIYAIQTNKIYLQRYEQNHGRELSFNEKLQILELLCNQGFSVDFSGGDPLYTSEDLWIVEHATHLLPAKKISVSTTGKDFSDQKLQVLKKVGVVELTIDALPERKINTRPHGYNFASYSALKKCIENGINARAVTVLTRNSLREESLSELYRTLCYIGVPEWEVLRFYPVGRAKKMWHMTPTEDELKQTMSFLLTLTGATRVVFQHSLPKLNEGHDYDCVAGREKIGILPDGTVTACAWALDYDKPIEEFKLGRLPNDDLASILDLSQSIYSVGTKSCRVFSCIKNCNSEKMLLETLGYGN